MVGENGLENTGNKVTATPCCSPASTAIQALGRTRNRKEHALKTLPLSPITQAFLCVGHHTTQLAQFRPPPVLADSLQSLRCYLA